MPFSMKIQPIDSHVPELEPVKPVVKSRLKRLFERQFSGVIRNPAPVKIAVEQPPHSCKDGSVDVEPSTACLAKLVQNYLEENHSVPVKCGRNRYSSFHDSDAEMHSFGGLSESNCSSSGEALEILKGLVACATVSERNLLADATKIIDKNKATCKRKDDFCRKIVTEALLALGYDASICKSRWEKSTFCPAGKYEYVDVIMGKERVVVDVDFRSEFEIARPTKTYRAILQTLPYIFVGTCERLQSIVAIVSEAAKLSLKKRGMHVPPWRKAEYVRAKWLSPCTCSRGVKEETQEKKQPVKALVLAASCESSRECDEKSKSKLVVLNLQEIKRKNSQSGLAAVFHENF